MLFLIMIIDEEYAIYIKTIVVNINLNIPLKLCSEMQIYRLKIYGITH